MSSEDIFMMPLNCECQTQHLGSKAYGGIYCPSTHSSLKENMPKEKNWNRISQSKIVLLIGCVISPNVMSHDLPIGKRFLNAQIFIYKKYQVHSLEGKNKTKFNEKLFNYLPDNYN